MSNNETTQLIMHEAFKALSNPNRLALFHRLMHCCTPGTVCSPNEAIRFCVGELGSELDIAPSTLSHHLKELNRAGLICMARNGKNVECWVEPGLLENMANFFSPEEIKHD